MAKTVRPVRPRLEAMSPLALDVLHLLEPVLGRIIATAVLRYACDQVEADPASLSREQLTSLIEPLERSMAHYDRVADLSAGLRDLAEEGEG